MADEKATPRRVKVTGEDATHRAGTKRAAIKPHKRTTETDVGAIITAYLKTLKAGSFVQSYVGDTLVKNAAALRAGFGLSATDKIYFLNDPTATGKAGVLLAASGVHLADGRGGTAAVTWKELASTTVGVQRGMLVIGKSGISTKDAQAMALMLQHIQSKLAK